MRESLCVGEGYFSYITVQEKNVQINLVFFSIIKKSTEGQQKTNKHKFSDLGILQSTGTNGMLQYRICATKARGI